MDKFLIYRLNVKLDEIYDLSKMSCVTFSR
jgi:hypothetical protein